MFVPLLCLFVVDTVTEMVRGSLSHACSVLGTLSKLISAEIARCKRPIKMLGVRFGAHECVSFSTQLHVLRCES